MTEEVRNEDEEKQLNTEVNASSLGFRSDEEADDTEGHHHKAVAQRSDDEADETEGHRHTHK